ncbi:MAG: hypothetical protein PHY56_04875 [Candidatus Omnitrophica bacterium]|nr:hypothetical protein [Candidatus Omnitrophota bacterium]
MFKWIGLAVIILLNVIVYFKTIFYKLISDDAIRMKIEPFPIKRTKSVNLLLHITVASFVFAAFGFSPVSFMAALLFSIHPLAVQVPVWCCARSYGRNALLFLTALFYAPFGAVVLFLNKREILPQILLTPLIFLFTPYWYLAIMVIPLYFAARKVWYISKKTKTENGIFSSSIPEDFMLHKFRLENLVLAVKTFGYYSLACIIPIKNGFYNSFLATLGSSGKQNKYWYSLNRHFWGGLLAMVIIGIIWAFNIHNYIGMGILLFVLSIGPFLNFITIQQFTAPRYAYLPLIGYQIALVGLISKITPVSFPITLYSAFCLNLIFRIFILGGLFALYLIQLLRVLPHYSTGSLDLMERDSQIFPDNPRLWYFRYEHALHKNNPILAWAEAAWGLKHNPDDCQLYFGLAISTESLGDLKGALTFLTIAEKFMIMTDRQSMKQLIDESKERIKAKEKK